MPLLLELPVAELRLKHHGIFDAMSSPISTIEIEPAPREVRIVRKGRVSVVVPLEPCEPLTAAAVQETIDSLRNRIAVALPTADEPSPT